MAVLASRSEPRCKLCQHPRRAEIDALLERRSNKEKDEAGNRINLEYVLRTFGEWGVQNPNEDNIKIHWRKHCERIQSEALEAVQHAALQKLEEMERDGVVIDINRDLDWLWAIGLAEIRERIARGEKSGITPDLLMKIAGEKTRRQHNETQDELLRALAGGIAGALAANQPVQLGRTADLELPAVEVEEAEVVES